jgi:hypothetical protein
MTNTFITDLTDYIQAQGIATNGQNLFVSGWFDNQDLPNVDVNQIMVDETGSVESDRDIPKLAPTIQFMARDFDYSVARSKLWSLYALFHQKHEYTMGGTSVMQSMAIQEPASIGKNDRGQEIFSFNVLFEIRNTY